MKILIIGDGGQAHACAWKIAKSKKVTEVFVAPGNAGTHREPKVENVAISPLEFDELIKFVKSKKIDLTIVSTKSSLVAGTVDEFQKASLAIFGPNQKSAQIESSKSYAKEFMIKYGIACAKSKTFTKALEAKKYIESHTYPLVIKTNDHTQDQSVVIAKSFTNALTTIEAMLEHNKFADQIIIEEFLQGTEASFNVILDGKNIIPLATSHIYKTRDDSEKGPITQGMGAYSPDPIITPELHDKIIQTIINPTIKGLEQEGCSYKGFLSANIMITQNQEPKVMDFHCKLCSPQCQIILMRLQSDLLELIQHANCGILHEYNINWDPRFALGVVLASKGYPQNFQTGDKISHLNEIPSSPNYKIFHSGTTIKESSIITNDGQVLCICALGDTIEKAQEKAYQLVNKISFDGAYYRTDIGYNA